MLKGHVMDARKEKIQQLIMFAILFMVVGVVLFVTQKIFSKKLPPTVIFVLFIITVIFFVIELVIYFIWGRDRKLEKTISSEPPSGFDSFLAGYLTEGKLLSNHFMSLVVALGIKGFLKVFKTDGELLIVRQKTPDKSLSKYERLMYKVLFRGSRTSIDLEGVTRELGRNFKRMQQLVTNQFANSSRVETPESRKLRRICGYILALLLLVTMIVYSYFSCKTITGRLLFVIGLTSLAGFMYILLSSLIIAFQTGDNTSIKYAAIVSSIFILGGDVVFPYFIIHFSNVGIMFMCQLNILFLCVIANGFIFKRSDYLNSKLSRLLGFRWLIGKYNPEGISLVYDENRDYFYRILPYIFAFNEGFVLLGGNPKVIEKPSFYENESGIAGVTLDEFYADMDSIDNAIIETF